MLPLCVDLDGTLAMHSVLRFIFKNALYTHPFLTVKHVLKSYFTEGNARSGLIHFWTRSMVKDIRFHPRLLADLHKARTKGHPIILATGAPLSIALDIAEHLGIFCEVMGTSPEEKPLVSHKKSLALCRRFGRGSFVYIGNSWEDIPVWKEAAWGVGVRTPQNLRTLGDRGLFTPYEVMQTLV